jgi:hypothetical protein
MKFYIVKNSDSKEVVVTEKLEPGEKPSPIHQEMIVPSTFFMQVPSNLLTRLLKNKYNENLEFKTEHLLRGKTHFVDSFRTVHGNSVQKDDILYQTHFDAIPGLARVKVKHVEEYKVDSVNPMFAARVVNGYEKVTVSRNIVGNASFDTLIKACQDHNHERAALVGYSTYNKRPGMLFIASDVEAARQMLASCEMRDASPLRQYANWTWYYTDSLSDVMEYIIDLLSSESLLQEMQMISESGVPLNPTTFGPPLIAEVAESFTEMGTGVSNVGGDTALEFLNIIGSYCDDRKVSVCDLHACHFPNPETRLAGLKFSTDKAYVRSGFCGILGLKSSPVGKMIKAEDLSYLQNYIPLNQRSAVAAELIEAVQQKFIPDIPVTVLQIYILSPEGLYYVDHRNEITAENLVTNDRHQLNTIADELGYRLNADFRGFKLDSLTHAMQVCITDTTTHKRKEIDKIFFVNKTTEECTPLNVSQKLIAQFDERMNFSLLNSDNRIFFFNELQWIQKYLKHDFQSVEEKKVSVKEEKTEEKPVPVTPAVENINDFLAGAAKKAQLHIAMKKYDKYKTVMDSIDSNHHDNVHQRIATSLSQKMFDDSIKKRLLEFINKYKNENIAHEAKRFKRA